jgi:DASS family divalent anion:Na+ symporter
MWYGGIIGLADALSKAKFFEWLAKLIAANVNFGGIPPLVVIAALVLFSLAVRYLFASMAAYVASMLPVLFTIALVAKVPLLPRGMAVC